MHLNRLWRAAASLILLAPLCTNAQSIQKYFGYYYGDINNPPANAIDETKDHVNVVAILNWSGYESPDGRAQSKAYLLSELAAVKAAHLHAIIPGYPFVFQGTKDCFALDNGAAASWSDVAQDLVSQGYLDQDHPDRSVIVAIYLVDEPNNHCLGDSNNVASNALVNAASAIRSNPNTSKVKLASNFAVTQKMFGDMAKGMAVLDWVGFDHYGISATQWRSELSTLKSYAQGKPLIIVPGAQSAVVLNECGGTDDPGAFIQQMTTDPQIIWMSPFVWFDKPGLCSGVRSIPSLRATYTNFGKTIKAQGCASSAAAGRFCKPPSIAPILDVILND